MPGPPEREDLKHNKGEQKKQQAQKARKKAVASLSGRPGRARSSNLWWHFRAAKTGKSGDSAGVRALAHAARAKL